MKILNLRRKKIKKFLKFSNLKKKLTFKFFVFNFIILKFFENFQILWIFLTYWLAKSNLCAIQNHIALSCHVISFIDFARECNMIFYCTGASGMDFVSSYPLFSTTPLFFQNFHINHSFFKIFIIFRFFFIWQYQ